MKKLYESMGPFQTQECKLKTGELLLALGDCYQHHKYVVAIQFIRLSTLRVVYINVQYLQFFREIANEAL